MVDVLLTFIVPHSSSWQQIAVILMMRIKIFYDIG
jgi:hypothetical protein